MISVRDMRELRAVVYGLRLIPRDLRNDINRAITAELGPAWKALVQERATGRMDALVLAPGARVKPGNPPVLLAAQSRRAIGRARRLVPNERWPGFEFGADREAYSRYERTSSKGTRAQVERRTARHLPPMRRQGRVVYPAVADFAPRAVSFVVQTFMRKVYDAFEGRA